MTCEEREALEQRICSFYYDSAKKSVQITVNYFKKEDVAQSTINYVLKEYLQYGTTKDLSQSAPPFKLSKKNLNKISQQSMCFKSMSNSTTILNALFNNFEDEHRQL